MILYFDLDGVMADFDKGYSRLVGRVHDTTKEGWIKIPNRDWKLITKADSFWLDLEPMPNARNLYGYWKEYLPVSNIKFCTSGGGDPKAHIQKPIWVDRFTVGVGHETLVVQNRKEKIKYAAGGNILIDDHEETIKWWNEAGGLGILYQDPIRKAEGLLL